MVVDAHAGEHSNKHRPALEAHGIRNVHLYEDEDWVGYVPRGRLNTLHKVVPEGVLVPERLIGTNIIDLRTVKARVFTTIMGVMKNAFGGLLFEKRHCCHATIHETQADLLRIQPGFHRGVFTLVDGTFVGDGPDPRRMRVQERGLLLAGSDQVSVDATIAHLMGLDPFENGFIRPAHEDGPGTADTGEIEVVGEDLDALCRQARIQQGTFAGRGQKAIYWDPLKPLERLLPRRSSRHGRTRRRAYITRRTGTTRTDGDARRRRWPANGAGCSRAARGPVRPCPCPYGAHPRLSIVDGSARPGRRGGAVASARSRITRRARSSG